MTRSLGVLGSPLLPAGWRSNRFSPWGISSGWGTVLPSARSHLIGTSDPGSFVVGGGLAYP
eukprot:13471395-Alexandrium_andersonii.AAC.1